MTTSPHQCQVILSLAHLLHQHSLSYDDEKDVLLSTTVTTANSISNQYSGGLHSQHDSPKGEVHLVLTGSPRPTFAETNAWLLDVNSSPGKKSNSNSGPKTPIRSSGSNNNNEQRSESNVSSNTTPGSMRGSYSILDNNVTALDFEESNTNNSNNVEEDENNANADDDDDDERRESGGAQLLVGQAVVNTVNQTKGVGLQSSRAKLLQGTIDRPLWDQRRWTDGECLFSDLIEKCGLKSFENVGGSSNSSSGGGGTLGGGVGAVADAAAGVTAAAGGIATTPAQHIKTSNLSANLITVPAENILDGEAIPGMAVGTITEIARGILRCLQRKKSPPANRVCLILPPVVDKEKEEERRTMVLASLKAAFQKLEQYNDMIGAPKLMAEAEFEFVNVSA